MRQLWAARADRNITATLSRLSLFSVYEAFNEIQLRSGPIYHSNLCRHHPHVWFTDFNAELTDKCLLMRRVHVKVTVIRLTVVHSYTDGVLTRTSGAVWSSVSLPKDTLTCGPGDSNQQLFDNKMLYPWAWNTAVDWWGSTPHRTLHIDFLCFQCVNDPIQSFHPEVTELKGFQYMNPLCCRIMFLCKTFSLLSQISPHKVDSCWIKQDLKDIICCHVGESAAQFSLSVPAVTSHLPPSLPPSPGGSGLYARRSKYYLGSDS